MKAVCIIGSPHKDGSTAFLVSRIADGMRTSGIEVKEHILGELVINYCQGCRGCEKSCRCVQRDDMDILMEEIREADIVLLASPSYWGDVTGQMKVFIDRCLPVCNAKTGETPIPEGKIGVGVAVRAGQAKAENEHLIQTFRHYFGHLGIDMAAQITVEGVDKLSDWELKAEKLEEAYRLGNMLIQHAISA